jgi:DNA/RNA-binding domain of Phe-tRNA-synthetase-like protein
MFSASERWQSRYPRASVGVLAMGGVANPKSHAEVENRKQHCEEELRARFAGLDRNKLKELPIIKAYDAYYGKFGKTYHVLLQLESVALKGKHLPNVGSLVDNMFTAELRNLLLTAGHDLDCVSPPLSVDVASGTESYTMYNGKTQDLKSDDMFIHDSQGVLSCILYGPDQRSRIKGDTKRVLFTTYAPPGIATEAVLAHLEEIRDGVLSITPEATIELLKVYQANPGAA